MHVWVTWTFPSSTKLSKAGKGPLGGLITVFRKTPGYLCYVLEPEEEG